MAKPRNKVNPVVRNKENTIRFWKAGVPHDKYQNEKDMSMKLVQIDNQTYEELIFDSSKSKFVAEKPYFLTFIDTLSQH